MEIHKPTVQPARSISPVWIIPIVAVVIALWLSVRAWQERGQEIEIIFDSASGIEVGQTQIRLKDVPVGKVTKVLLSADLSKVRVLATIDREVSQHLSENTRFWLVSPRVSATGVSNLGTLISGVYIVMEPGKKGEFYTTFKGLAEPPAVQSDDLGTQFILLADTLGSLDIGSPVYYKQLKVGEVTGYKLGEQGQNVEIRIFIEAPHDKLVYTRSRFWNVSGVNVTVGADGIKANIASVASLISGGITFDSHIGFESKKWAESDHHFYLYPDKSSVDEERYTLKYYYRLKYSHSVRGLSVGAPVEFRGMRIGTVEDIQLNSVSDEDESLHVIVNIEPQRLNPDSMPTREEFDKLVSDLVAVGLKAQIKSGNLITGSRYIDLVFDKSKPEDKFLSFENYSQIPTLDHPSDQLDEQLANLTAQINKIPLGKIGEDLSETLASISGMMKTFKDKGTAEKFDKTLYNVSEASNELQEVMKGLAETIDNAGEALSSVDAALAPDSQFQYELSETLKSAKKAADSLELFLESLNQKPDALIFGREKDE